MTIRPGLFINDRYEIIDKVGSGGMADVYKAKDHRLNRFVAVKVLKAEFSDDTKFVDKFRAEAQSAAGLSHPNVVNVYDVGDEDGMHYIVMELVEGITLKSFIERKGKLDVKEAVGIAIQIAQGMDAAHSNHIVHRDIKPQNIIISREGKVKVTDFGIAKAVTSDTITSNAMGSVHYLSPEQARGGFSDEKSDIYSLGVTMYEMLTGRVPFIGENTVAVALCHLQEEAAPLRDIDPSIPLSLDRIVQKCMQKKPEYRYLSAAALITDLKKSLSNPDGAYVQIASAVVDDSPTINFTAEDLEKIKSAENAAKQNAYSDGNEDVVEQQGKQGMKMEPIDDDDEDDDDEEEVNPKLEKLMSAGGILAAVLIVFIVIFIIVKMSGCFGGGSASKEEATASPEMTAQATEMVSNTVPSVEGLMLADVQSQLEELGLTVNVTEESSNEVEAGKIISQDIEEGTIITEGMTINLVVSKGKDEIVIANVTGETADDATTTLKAQGFEVSAKYIYNDTVAAGKVIETNPAAGTAVEKGTTVVIVVSQGPEKKSVEVPKLVGLTKKEAKSELTGKGLTLGAVTKAYSSTVAAGKVISQGTTAGTEVDPGTAVSIVISQGPEPTYTYRSNSVVIDENPFTEEDETGTIKCILKQDGQSKQVYQGSHSMGDFPLVIPSFEGFSSSEGTLNVYLDGQLFATVSVTFTKVQD